MLREKIATHNLSHIIYVSIFYHENFIHLSITYHLCFTILSTKLYSSFCLMSFMFQYFINKIMLIFLSHSVYVSIFYQQNYNHHSVSYRLCFNILINKIIFTFSVSYHFISFLCHSLCFNILSTELYSPFLSYIIYVSIFYQQNYSHLSVSIICFNILSTKRYSSFCRTSFMFQYSINKIKLIVLSHIIDVSIF